MTAVTAGTSKTFTAQVDGSTFVVIAPGGAVGSVIDQNGNTQAIDPNGTRRTFGPLRELQSITVSMQIGNASVELNGWSGGMPITAETNSTGQTVLDDASKRSVDSALFKRTPKLRKLYAAIAKVLSGQGQCFIGLIDDSTGVGAGAGTGGKGLLNARPGGPLAHLASLLTSMGIPAAEDSWMGEHLMEAFNSTLMSAYDTRFSVGASATYYTNGAFQTLGGLPFRLSSAGKSVSFTPTNQADTAKIFYANRFGGTFDTTFAGGASLGTTVATGATTIGSVTKAFTRGSGALTNSWVSGDNAILGAICYDSTTPRVNLVNLSCYGEKLTSNNGYANNTNADFRGGAALSVLGLDAVIVGMTVNSENQDGLAGVDAYKAALIKVCNDVLAAGSDLILSTPHNIGTVPQTSGICDAYVAAIREVAAQFDAPLIDLYQRLDSYSTFNALGLYFDTLHLTTIGYRAKAQEFARVLNVWS